MSIGNLAACDCMQAISLVYHSFIHSIVTWKDVCEFVQQTKSLGLATPGHSFVKKKTLLITESKLSTYVVHMYRDNPVP